MTPIPDSLDSELKVQSSKLKAARPKRESPIFYPKTPAAWRKWLHKNHDSEESVWLVQHHKNSGLTSISWSDAVDQALCYGWIDSKKVKIDEQTTHQFFSRRKPKGSWSKINKDKVERLIASGEMQPAGQKAIDTAKANGAWNLLDEIEELLVPADLETALRHQPAGMQFFQGLSKSIKKMMLHWVLVARKPETREKRINEIAELAAIGKKPKQF